MLDVTAGNSRHNVGQPGPSRYECKSTLPIERTFIKVFSTDSRRNFVDDRNTFKAATHPIEEVHNSAARNKKAVRIAELD
jgi:hypothetical protein